MFAANPIPGNEKFVSRTVDNLLRLGADVIYNRSRNPRFSHANQEEIKLVLSLLKPKLPSPSMGNTACAFAFKSWPLP